MKALNFRQTIKALGYEIVEYHKGYNYRSCFATKDGQLYYLSLGDLRIDSPTFLWRTAENTKDYCGGPNHFYYKEDLEELGIRLVEPRGKTDYNSM